MPIIAKALLPLSHLNIGYFIDGNCFGKFFAATIDLAPKAKALSMKR